MDNKKLEDFVKFCEKVDKVGEFQYYKRGSRWVDFKVDENCHGLSFRNFEKGRIRLKPEVKTIPLECTDIKPNTVLRWPAFSEGMFTSVLCITEKDVNYHWPYNMDLMATTYKGLYNSGVEYSNDNRKTWQKCEKETTDE